MNKEKWNIKNKCQEPECFKSMTSATLLLSIHACKCASHTIIYHGADQSLR